MKTHELDSPSKLENNLLKGQNKSGQLKKVKLQPLSKNSNTESQMLKKADKIKQRIQKTADELNKKQRKFVPDEYDQKAIVLCQFCGGQTCPQQDYLTNKIQPNAVQGLHSNWITQNILAMQRPSTRLMKQFNLIQTFHKYQINTILNLQEPGQHPYCGDGIDGMVGFSYDPQLFFNNKIRFQNQYWEDMTSTSYQQMMKIMNIFQNSIVKKRGKISVHCHAGRGRTLMAICAWLIYHDRMTAQQTIQLAVLKRQGVLTKTSQRDFLRDFQSQSQKRWKNYYHDFSSQSIKSFNQFVSWQHVSLLKSQQNKLNQTAFAHGTIISLLRKRMKSEYKQIIHAFIDLNDPVVFEKKWDKEHEHRLTFLKTYLDQKKTTKIEQNQDIRIIVLLLQDFYDNLPFTPLSLHAIDQLQLQFNVQKQIYNNSKNKRQLKKQSLKNKILKNWQDFGYESKDKDKIPNLQIQSRVKQTNKDQNQPAFNVLQKDFLKVQTKIQTEGSFNPGATGSFIKSQIKSEDGQFSELSCDSIYLKILMEPSIVHEIGLHSLCTLLDFVRFAMQLIQLYEQNQPNSNSAQVQSLKKCLLTKFSILLQSKKRFFPVLFRGANLRESYLKKKIEKIQKYSNSNIKYLAQTFMKGLSNEVSSVVLDEEIYKKLIFKLKKVDANVNYFSKSFGSSEGKFFSIKDAKKVYDSSRI